jgi:hypothetical protein
MVLLADHPDWRPVTAVVTEVEHRSGRSQSLETDDHPAREYYVVHFRYVVNDRSYSGDFESRMPLEPGGSLTLLYNPAAPQENSKSAAVVTQAGRIRFWVMAILVIAVMILVGLRLLGS